MRWWHEIERQLAEPSASVACIHPTTAEPLEVHRRLKRFTEQPQPATRSLDLFEPDDQIEIIKAFASVMQQGRSSTEARLTGGEMRHVDFYDEAEALGCFVVVFTPSSGVAATQQDGPIELKVRTASYSVDRVGLITWAHPDIERVFGWTPEELVGHSTLEFAHPNDQAQSLASWIDLLERGAGSALRNRRRFRSKDDQWRWIEATSTNHFEDPDIAAVITDVIDISDEMAALEEAKRREALLTRLTEALPGGVLHLGTDGFPVFWNQRWSELLSHAAPSIEGLLEQVAERTEVAEAIERSLTAGVDADLDVTIVGGPRLRYGRLHLRPLEHADGTAEALVTLDDITQAREYQQDLHDLAHSDSLTGVLGRLGARPLIEQLLTSSAPSRALLFIDLDAFKPINDTYGHATGDAVLRAVGQAISSAVRERDAVARIGGDEFIVTIQGSGPAEKIADRIHAALRNAETTIDHPVEIRASIGLAMVEPGDTFDTVLSRADEAMYEVKRAKEHRSPAAISPAAKRSLRER